MRSTTVPVQSSNPASRSLTRGRDKVLAARGRAPNVLGLPDALIHTCHSTATVSIHGAPSPSDGSWRRHFHERPERAASETAAPRSLPPVSALRHCLLQHWAGHARGRAGRSAQREATRARCAGVGRGERSYCRVQSSLVVMLAVAGRPGADVV
jgi:hypothetical protein